jgi:hypothetical protein
MDMRAGTKSEEAGSSMVTIEEHARYGDSSGTVLTTQVQSLDEIHTVRNLCGPSALVSIRNAT